MSRPLVLAMLCGLALAGCGSGRTGIPTTPRNSQPSHSRHTVYLYSSLPESGPQKSASAQIVSGIQLELHGIYNRVGAYTIKYKRLADSTRKSNGWSPIQTVTNAETAASNTHTIAYIGDLDSGATELSLPILNQAGIVQITLGSGYPGLTEYVKNVTPVTVPPEPQKFYPASIWSLLRLIPNDTVQAAAALDWLKQSDCQAVAAARFGGGTDGQTLLNAIRYTAPPYGLRLVPTLQPGAGHRTYLIWAASLRTAGVQCVVLTGQVTAAAVQLTKDIHAELPTALILGTAGFCNARWTSLDRHGAATSIDHYLYCTSPLLPLSLYSGTGKFVAQYRAMFKRQPSSYALYGYQAAEMVVGAMAGGLATDEDYRQVVLEDLIDSPPDSETSGPFAFDRHGDLLSRDYPLYQVVAGHRKFYKILTPNHVLSGPA